MLLKNNNVLMPFKGDHRPVNVYVGDKKISGWDYQTFSGTDLSIADTYNDNFKSLTLLGRYEQAEPSIDNPIYPTFSGNCKLYIGNDNVDIPALAVVSNYYDEITMIDGQVLHTRKSKYIPINAGNVNNFVAYNSGLAWYDGHMAVYWYSITPLMLPDVGLCNYCTLKTPLDVAYPHEPARGITDNFAIANNRLYITMRRETLGLSSDLPQADCVTAIKDWLISLDAVGNPFTFYVALETPIVTDITNTELGQALLALRTTPYNTHIYDDGALACNKSAEVKVFGRTS